MGCSLDRPPNTTATRFLGADCVIAGDPSGVSPLISGHFAVGLVAADFFPVLSARSESMMARTKSRPVALSAADREWLVKRVRTGSYPAQQVRRARILLELDENVPDRVGP